MHLENQPDRLGMIQNLLVKIAPILGLKPDEAKPLWDAVAARLRDAKAFFYGGQLTDGTPVPGVAELVRLANANQAKLEIIEAKLLSVNGVAVHHVAKKKGGA